MPTETLSSVFVLVVLLPTSGLFPRTEAALVASSSIEYCERSSKLEPFPCEKKMVVTLSVGGGQKAGVEEVVLLREAVDKTGDEKGKRVEFEPVRMVTTESPVRYRYPIYYIRNFNAKPYEQRLRTSASSWCDDSSNPGSATCGVARDRRGDVIPYSQGFCCLCGACALSGICNPTSRSVGTCSVTGDTGMASCLRFSDLWYGGYTIGRGVVWYELQVKLSSGNNSTGGGSTGSKEFTMSLGPDKLTATSTEFGASARLIGDFAPPEMPLDLSGKMLFIPSEPRGHERVGAGYNEWIIVDTHLVSIRGTECNKVGVSYEGFATQGSRCDAYPGACLANQLEDYRDRDLEAETKGERGKYMARFFAPLGFDPLANASAPAVSYQASGTLSTIVTITISADKLNFVLSVSSGVIVGATVSGKVVHSYSRGSTITVTVLNTGDIEAQYTVVVGECTVNVQPMVAQTVYIPPKGSAQRRFTLIVQDSIEGEAKCNATLRNARGDVVDTRAISFGVKALKPSNGSQGGSTSENGGYSEEAKGESQCQQCSWFNLLCFLRHRCWWQPLVYVLPSVTLLMLLRRFLESQSRSRPRPQLHPDEHELRNTGAISSCHLPRAPYVNTVH
ncbi:hypothetical protein, conserved [Trypanosoma brucei gambiense DAL972]|uniref:Generative cell specific-1/HAP2 domain-containing protein n=1 Tax=Trypanosoma brucei gambiense (strain MHOM/CI/86/DAL972) TaxID=679716 RepID=D0A4L4_TRYB9|nr:hypothetical protein, conserved [Trypanosoma brucei gambiense DAL972]CBH16208.1 hypothetical protein, conserved [Trypanosoma brucei gambiense DAL972]|eukprot:XP_011778472.1 hypothetical protein, conserved [Trypanosoma brucei gambiense DAL972]